jgi:hypothetical protein
MANDVVMPSNPQVAPLEEEMLEKSPFDLNLSQQLHDKNAFRKVVRIEIDHSAWDHRSSLNSHALTIYLEFVFTRGTTLERFEECHCEHDDVCFHCRTWVPSDGHYHWLQSLINSLPMEHQVEYLACTICHLLDFLQL